MNSLVALDEVKAAGFTAFEFWHWQEKDIDALAKKAAALGLNCAGLCTKSFKLTEPEQRETLIQGLRESIVQAKKMGASFLITQSGNDTGAARQLQRQSIVDGLKAAAPLLEAAGITLLLEPLNAKIDHPGIYLEYSDEGFEILKHVGSPNVKLLFDIYHQQITEGDIIRRMISHIGEIGHIHCAGNPGRHELDSGELDFGRIFKALKSAGYNAYAGIEYFPSEAAAAGLGRLRIPLANSSILILSIAFPYAAGDAAFSEELAVRINDLRAIAGDYFSSLPAGSLHQIDEEAAKQEILRRFNANLRLGQITVIYFSDMMVIDASF
jgi:hydroxypyruvate isomerase